MAFGEGVSAAVTLRVGDSGRRFERESGRCAVFGFARECELEGGFNGVAEVSLCEEEDRYCVL